METALAENVQCVKFSLVWLKNRQAPPFCESLFFNDKGAQVRNILVSGYNNATKYESTRQTLQLTVVPCALPQ